MSCFFTIRKDLKHKNITKKMEPASTTDIVKLKREWNCANSKISRKSIIRENSKGKKFKAEVKISTKIRKSLLSACTRIRSRGVGFKSVVKSKVERRTPCSRSVPLERIRRHKGHRNGGLFACTQPETIAILFPFGFQGFHSDPFDYSLPKFRNSFRIFSPIFSLSLLFLNRTIETLGSQISSRSFLSR